ncbi:hypothetical protein PAPYR_5085 [Paratrimastix pyriformis]|uniref:PIK helical domain-containing protein n=1 Tax=Paratrimastix pyriformis TaxID=342808 RepID=A0ABQ8UNY0_9EUKA|nr:hypothetical protein PAPYR_5085 [Paratrimastix pyriformis]
MPGCCNDHLGKPSARSTRWTRFSSWGSGRGRVWEQDGARLKEWFASVMPPRVGAVVRAKLSPTQCLALATVWHLESLRTIASASRRASDPTCAPVAWEGACCDGAFLYLEDPGLGASEMRPCIDVIIDKVFGTLLETLRLPPATPEAPRDAALGSSLPGPLRGRLLDGLVALRSCDRAMLLGRQSARLMAIAAHALPRVKQAALRCLDALLQQDPTLLWEGPLVPAAMHIMQALEASIQGSLGAPQVVGHLQLEPWVLGAPAPLPTAASIHKRSATLPERLLECPAAATANPSALLFPTVLLPASRQERFDGLLGLVKRCRNWLQAADAAAPAAVRTLMHTFLTHYAGLTEGATVPPPLPEGVTPSTPASAAFLAMLLIRAPAHTLRLGASATSTAAAAAALPSGGPAGAAGGGALMLPTSPAGPADPKASPLPLAPGTGPLSPLEAVVGLGAKPSRLGSALAETIASAASEYFIGADERARWAGVIDGQRSLYEAGREAGQRPFDEYLLDRLLASLAAPGPAATADGCFLCRELTPARERTLCDALAMSGAWMMRLQRPPGRLLRAHVATLLEALPAGSLAAVRGCLNGLRWALTVPREDSDESAGPRWVSASEAPARGAWLTATLREVSRVWSAPFNAIIFLRSHKLSDLAGEPHPGPRSALVATYFSKIGTGTFFIFGMDSDLIFNRQTCERFDIFHEPLRFAFLVACALSNLASSPKDELLAPGRCALFSPALVEPAPLPPRQAVTAAEYGQLSGQQRAFRQGLFRAAQAHQCLQEWLLEAARTASPALPTAARGLLVDMMQAAFAVPTRFSRHPTMYGPRFGLLLLALELAEAAIHQSGPAADPAATANSPAGPSGGSGDGLLSSASSSSAFASFVAAPAYGPLGSPLPLGSSAPPLGWADWARLAAGAPGRAAAPSPEPGEGWLGATPVQSAKVLRWRAIHAALLWFEGQPRWHLPGSPQVLEADMAQLLQLTRFLEAHPPTPGGLPRPKGHAAAPATGSSRASGGSVRSGWAGGSSVRSGAGTEPLTEAGTLSHMATTDSHGPGGGWIVLGDSGLMQLSSGGGFMGPGPSIDLTSAFTRSVREYGGSNPARGFLLTLVIRAIGMAARGHVMPSCTRPGRCVCVRVCRGISSIASGSISSEASRATSGSRRAGASAQAFKQSVAPAHTRPEAKFPAQREELPLAARWALLHLLISHEIDRNVAWHDPRRILLPARLGCISPRIRWSQVGQSLWRVYVRTAWCVSPALAVSLRFRFRNAVVHSKLESLLSADPDAAMQVPEAAILLACPEAVRRGTITRLAYYQAAPAHVALFLLSPLCPVASHPAVRSYALRSLRQLPADRLVTLIPQLLMALRPAPPPAGSSSAAPGQPTPPSSGPAALATGDGPALPAPPVPGPLSPNPLSPPGAPPAAPPSAASGADVGSSPAGPMPPVPPADRQPGWMARGAPLSGLREEAPRPAGAPCPSSPESPACCPPTPLSRLLAASSSAQYATVPGDVVAQVRQSDVGAMLLEAAGRSRVLTHRLLWLLQAQLPPPKEADGLPTPPASAPLSPGGHLAASPAAPQPAPPASAAAALGRPAQPPSPPPESAGSMVAQPPMPVPLPRLPRRPAGPPQEMEMMPPPSAAARDGLPEEDEGQPDFEEAAPARPPESARQSAPPEEAFGRQLVGLREAVLSSLGPAEQEAFAAEFAFFGGLTAVSALLKDTPRELRSKTLICGEIAKLQPLLAAHPGLLYMPTAPTMELCLVDNQPASVAVMKSHAKARPHHQPSAPRGSRHAPRDGI